MDVILQNVVSSHFKKSHQFKKCCLFDSLTFLVEYNASKILLQNRVVNITLKIKIPLLFY